MNPIPTTTVLALLRWRYATKQFDPSKKISADHWEAMEQCLLLSPSSFGLQPWKFTVVTNAAVKEKLVGASWGQKQITDGSHVVVFAIKKDLNIADVERHMKRIEEVRGTPPEKLEGYKKVILNFLAQPADKFNVNDWSARQCYIALGDFMRTASMLGIDTCPMEGISPAKYDEILGLSAKGYQTVVACVAGYRSEQDKTASLPKVRFKKEDVIEIIP